MTALKGRQGEPLRVVPAVLTRAFSMLASFVLTVAIARMLGAAAGGAFFVVLTTVVVFATFARFGTDILALKLIGGARPSSWRDFLWLHAICGGGSVLAICAALMSFVAFHHLLPGVTMSSALIGSAAIAPQAISVLSGAILRGAGWLPAGVLAELGSVPLITVITLMAENLANRATLSGAIIALSIASWLTAGWAVPAAVYSMRSLLCDAGGQQTSHVVHDFIGRRLGGLASMMGTSLLFYALTWAPVFVLAGTAGSREVGLFTVAARLAAFTTLVSSIQVSYLAPAFARLYHRREMTVLNDLCNRSAWLAAIAAAGPGLVFVAASGPVVRLLYGPGFNGAATCLVLLTIAGFATVLAGQVNQLMLLCELENSALALNVGWLVSWVVIGSAISRLGGVNAVAAFALASGVAYLSLAARLLVDRRGIYSYVRLPVRLIGYER